MRIDDINPPFVSKQDRDEYQQSDMKAVCNEIDNNGLLDYVACWYVKAAKYIQNSKIKVAFVSTNAITHGEQVGVLWEHLIRKENIKINFAHKRFRWSNDARGNAHVFVVIIGFSLLDERGKFIFDYETPDSEPVRMRVTHINPYLVDFKDIFLTNRNKPICEVPQISFGSMPNDGGNLIFSNEEMEEFVRTEPLAKKFIYPLISSKEFLHGEKRWCLWLKDAEPQELHHLPFVMKRIEKVRAYRLSSKRMTTVKLSDQSSLFGEIRQPSTNYILIPRVSSELRKYIPMGFYTKEDIVSDTCLDIPEGTLYHFGVLMSSMHMAWVNSVCGRLKGDYRYSNNLVYNNFPWPRRPSDSQIEAVKKAANSILECRKKHGNSTLAELYNPLTMPKDLLTAHRKLDKIVEKLYGANGLTFEIEKLSLLFDLYLSYTSNQATF